MIRRTTIVLIAIAACLGVAACGSSDDSSSDDGTLSRSELAAKADAICKTGENDAKTVTAPASFADANDAAAYFAKIVPLHQKQTDSLAALKPDADAKADWDAFIATQNANQQLLDTILAKAKAKDPTGQADLQKFTSPVAEVRRCREEDRVRRSAPARRSSRSSPRRRSPPRGAGPATTSRAPRRRRRRRRPPGRTARSPSSTTSRPTTSARRPSRSCSSAAPTASRPGFTKSFKLPFDITIHVVNGLVGPNYDPSTKTMTLSYGFVNFTAGVLKKNFPELRTDDEEFGKQLAAVDGFILVHEFGHAFVDAFELPVLGREEDAADAVATVFLTRAVTTAREYAFDAARFFNALSARQRNLAAADYFDEHSLDKQRAYSIVCLDRGLERGRPTTTSRSSGSSARRASERCPAEYQQKVKAVEELLKPHARA